MRLCVTITRTPKNTSCACVATRLRAFALRLYLRLSCLAICEVPLVFCDGIRSHNYPYSSFRGPSMATRTDGAGGPLTTSTSVPQLWVYPVGGADIPPVAQTGNFGPVYLDDWVCKAVNRSLESPFGSSLTCPSSPYRFSCNGNQTRSLP